jgi:hypothetical protein
MTLTLRGGGRHGIGTWDTPQESYCLDSSVFGEKSPRNFKWRIDEVWNNLHRELPVLDEVFESPFYGHFTDNHQIGTLVDGMLVDGDLFQWDFVWT